MDYKEVYDFLYSEGYHITELKNWGLMYSDYIIDNYDFESILDVGCSNGLNVKEYQNKGKDAYGIDISEIAINKAKDLGIKNCIQSNILSLPFKDKFFDVVFSCDVLEHLECNDVDKAIKELKRITKKYMFIKVATGIEKNRKWISLLNNKYDKYKNLDNLHLTCISIKDWIKKFEDNDLICKEDINNKNLLIVELKETLK